MVASLRVVVGAPTIEDHPDPAAEIGERHDPADRRWIGEPNLFGDGRTPERKGRVGEDDAEEDGDELPYLAVAQGRQKAVLARAKGGPVAIEISLDETLFF